MDAVRNAIAFSGKRLYWSHAKVVIVGDEVARKGVAPILDWINRDAETRSDIFIMIAKDHEAADIFAVKPSFGKITSFILADLMENQKALSKAPRAEIWKFNNELTITGLSAVAPVIELANQGGEEKPRLLGTAIFKKDKLQGYLDGDESKILLFIRNQIEGGVINIMGPEGNPIALEIFHNKTELKPEVKNGILSMNIKVSSVVAIDEVEGHQHVIDPGGSTKAEQIAQQSLKHQIERLISKVQQDYQADIFGFGAKFHTEQPRVWKQVEKDWENYFTSLAVNCSVKVHIRNSARMFKTIDVGD